MGQTPFIGRKVIPGHPPTRANLSDSFLQNVTNRLHGSLFCVGRVTFQYSKPGQIFSIQTLSLAQPGQLGHNSMNMRCFRQCASAVSSGKGRAKGSAFFSYKCSLKLIMYLDCNNCTLSLGFSPFFLLHGLLVPWLYQL